METLFPVWKVYVPIFSSAHFQHLSHPNSRTRFVAPIQLVNSRFSVSQYKKKISYSLNISIDICYGNFIIRLVKYVVNDMKYKIAKYDNQIYPWCNAV